MHIKQIAGKDFDSSDSTFDSYLYTIVNARLASTIESTNVLDHMIAAYDRKGRSSTPELTFNNLLALQGAISDTAAQPLLAQIDEDKDKYFDRISTELQLLPFHIISFPQGGYTECIAESLSDVKIHTNTPFGTCINSFNCGVRQGSALSCTIANMVGWLSATAWLSPPTLPSPSSSTTDPTNPHSGYRPPTLYKTKPHLTLEV